MTEHTPTPWTTRLHDTHIVAYDAAKKIKILSTSWHGHIRGPYPLKAESIANMEFAVRAVNSHDALIAVIKDARHFVRADVGNYATALLEKIDSALALAEVISPQDAEQKDATT